MTTANFQNYLSGILYNLLFKNKEVQAMVIFGTENFRVILTNNYRKFLRKKYLMWVTFWQDEKLRQILQDQYSLFFLLIFLLLIFKFVTFLSSTRCFLSFKKGHHNERSDVLMYIYRFCNCYMNTLSICLVFTINLIFLFHC